MTGRAAEGRAGVRGRFTRLRLAVLLAALVLAACAMPSRHEPLKSQPIRFLLTFDDGPSGRDEGNPTAAILDTLASNPVQNGIKAIFFVQTRSSDGGATARGKALLRREQAEGHVVELHDGGSWGHRSHRNLDDALLEKTLTDGKADLAGMGIEARLVRPPYWAFDARTLAAYSRHELSMLLTDVSANDGKDWGFRASPRRYIHMAWEMDRLRDRLRQHLLRGDVPAVQGVLPVVVTFHDTNDYTASHMSEYLAMLVDSAHAAGLPVANPPYYGNPALLREAALARSGNDPADHGMVPWWWRWMLW